MTQVGTLSTSKAAVQVEVPPKVMSVTRTRISTALAVLLLLTLPALAAGAPMELITAPDADVNDRLGTAVAVDGSVKLPGLPPLQIAVTGVPHDDDGATATFIEAGHILGSACILVELKKPKPIRILYSGDLGRFNMPILKDPTSPLPKVDYLITEVIDDKGRL